MNKNSDQLKKILTDNKSGSYQILLNLKMHFLKNVDDIEYLKKSIQVAGKSLKHFAAIDTFLKVLGKKLKSNNPSLIRLFLSESINYQKNQILFLFEKNKSLLLKFNTITTISFSKTLLEIFELLHKSNPGLKIYILESRPMLEGRNLAKQLIKTGIECIYIVDAMMNYAVKNSDAVIVGADQILKNGSIVNKIGSYLLALCAKELNKPYYVIATNDKFINSVKFHPKFENQNEVWNYKNKDLKILNTYFELVPKELITRILSN